MTVFGLGDLAFLGAVGGGGERDPFFSNVSLLLHGEGANNSTTFTDNSPTPKTPTVFGDARISTTEKCFGNSSIYFNGSTRGDRLTYAATAGLGFGTGDFTIEAWVFLSTAGDRTIFSADSFGIIIFPTGYSNRRLRVINSGGVLVLADSSDFPLSTWTHIALTRSGTTLSLFVAGTQVASVSNNVNYGSTSGGVVGAWMAGGQFNWLGYIDELRVTKGVARYTSNFTPPTAPFPDA